MNIPKIWFVNLLCLVSFNFFAQQEIRYKEYSKCDTSQGKVIKVEMGDLHCIAGGGKDYIIYFTKKEGFQNFVQKNKLTSSSCMNHPEMIFDFNKYDVVFARIGFGSGLDSTCVVFEENDSYIIDLNFYLNEKNIGHKREDGITEYQNTAVRYIYSRYFLLPKGKVNPPKFGIYNTSNKCF